LLSIVPVRAASFDDDVSVISGQDSPRQYDAHTHLMKGGSDAMSALVKGLSGKDRQTRIRIVTEIGEMRRENKSLQSHDFDAAEMARQAKSENDPAMRGLLLQGVCDVGGASAVKELEEVASQDTQAYVRRSATHYVANIAPQEVAFFKKRATDPDRIVKLEAYVDLAEAGDSSGRDLAMQVLKSSATDMERHDAIWILGESGNPSDASLLKNITQSQAENAEAKFLATEALKTIELLQVPAANRPSFLLNALDDDSPTVRHWAYLKLYRSPDLLTNTRLRVYLITPGHKGYSEAADALASRK